MQTSKFELDVWAYSRREWANPRRREWAAEHGIKTLDQFHADCLRVAREAVEDGLPWADALDA